MYITKIYKTLIQIYLLGRNKRRLLRRRKIEKNKNDDETNGDGVMMKRKKLEQEKVVIAHLSLPGAAVVAAVVDNYTHILYSYFYFYFFFQEKKFIWSFLPIYLVFKFIPFSACTKWKRKRKWKEWMKKTQFILMRNTSRISFFSLRLSSILVSISSNWNRLLRFMFII